MEIKKRCPKCNNTGMITGSDRSVTICIDCLKDGSLDQCGKIVDNSRIKL